MTEVQTNILIVNVLQLHL